MLKIEHTEVMGWEAAIRGMRNPMNSWEKSDSHSCDTLDCHNCITYINHEECPYGYDYLKTIIGPNDLNLMMRLRNAGTDHRKFMRMITVYVDVTGPLYWWKEFKTYRAGRKFGDDEPDIIGDGYLEYDIEMDSCSTMHKIHSKEFELDDFSHEHLFDEESLPPYEERIDIGQCEVLAAIDVDGNWCYYTPQHFLKMTCNVLNHFRNLYIKTNDKKYWWQMIQLLPTSYNQKRTVMLNYEVLANMYKSRKNHKLDEWHTFCDWIEMLPYSELITGNEKEEK